MRESLLQKRVITQLKTLPDIWVTKLMAGSIRGLPDVIALYQGIFIALELKRSEAEANKTEGRIALQKYVLQCIEKAGGYSRIVHPDNWQDTFTEIKGFGSSELQKQKQQPR